MAILVVSASVVVENRQLSDISKQAEAANNIQSGANDLNYLTNNFFLYQEDAKLVEWRTTLVSIYDEILKLNSTNLQQQTYVNNIKNDLGDIALSYNGLVTFLWNSSRNVSVRATPEFQKAWNHTSEQYRALNTDSAVLITFLADQATQARLTITELVLVVFGLFGAYFLMNYLVTYRRTIKSILGLKAVTKIVGSGNLDYQIKVERKDEIGELAAAFNQMTSHLKSVTASKTELDMEISERKKEEIKLKESEEKYQTTFEGSMDALMLFDGKRFFDCNKASLLLFGCKTVEEFSKFHPADLSPLIQPNGLPSMEAALSHINRAFETGVDSFFWVHKRVDGSIFPADVLLTRIMLKGKDVLQATVRDVTRQKEAEEKLKEAEEKHRTLLNAANVLVQSVDVEGKYLFVNEEWKKVLGYTEVDLEEITMMDVVRKDHLQYCMSVFKKVMNGSSVNDVEAVFVDKDGREVVVRGNACPVFKDGKFVSTVAFFMDITERRKIEEKLKENSQRIELMVEKLRVVGSLTRHDVRNKLSAITGYAYLLKKKHADEADIIEGLSKMEESVKETIRIFDFAKMYEQLGAEELTYIDVEDKLNEAITLFSSPLPKIINECHGLSVLADSFLRQLFYNFIDNTKKYGQKTTTIRVHYEKNDQDNLRLVYEDDGVGVPLENKRHLFKEGFSTGGSTGFGLFLTKRMMDVYGWIIMEEGEPGKGVKFTMTIPKLSKSGKENYQIV